jgi:hypothetical protein
VKGQMSMWRRRLPIVAAAGLFAVANLGVFLAYRTSTNTRRQALETRREDLKRAVAAGEAEAAKVSVQKDRLGGVSAAMDEFYGHRIGTEKETLAAIVAELHRILKETNVSVPQISYGVSAVPKLPLIQMRVGFSVKCDYARFKKLLHGFESSRSWLVVRDVSISRDAEPGSVQVQLDLITYFADSDLAPGKPKTDAGARGVVPARKVG